ncbi:MAG: CDP-alcohol phosphatidyltransferase family protein [Deltaproteobacteria bacterium]|nr:CDP-alcohol phosphatidyltransferase family protein [Deltaproteobacteria bacterium]
MKITANMVTIARIILLPLPAYLLYQGVPELYYAFALIVFLGFTDWLDGIMARKEGPTVLGGLLDPIADKIFIAVCFIPFSQRILPGMERVAFPLWMLIAMLTRDFVVTSLRTSLSVRGVPMRTSLLAKFKTAIQMTAAGYLIVIVISQLVNPKSMILSNLFFAVSAIPLVYIILSALFKKQRPGIRSLTMFSMTVLYAVIFKFADLNISLWVLAIVVSSITVFSGFSYLADAFTALKDKHGRAGEIFKYILDGFLVPVFFLLPLGYSDSLTISFLVILALTFEFAVGGLSNLLASKKKLIRLKWIALKGILVILLAGASVFLFYMKPFSNHDTLASVLMSAAVAVSFINAVFMFVRHRFVYQNQL